MKRGRFEAVKGKRSAEASATVESIHQSDPESGSESEKQSISSTILLYIHDIVFLVAAIILIFSLLFRFVIVSGPSMFNTLVDGDFLLLLSNTFYKNPQYGDIVVISMDDFDEGEPIVKRIIATEGQTVDIDFEEGIVYVDGTALEESYTYTPTNTYQGIQFPLTVDDGCVFVLGDNRNISKDSRNPEIGLIDKREILGKAIFLIFPGNDDGNVQRQFNRIGALC
ncbi:MAG: signal peptidase I [Oscillospiraceae bacterium]|nr:signal peptidase I [Oscillospiraceae bacterium]